MFLKPCGVAALLASVTLPAIAWAADEPTDVAAVQVTASLEETLPQELARYGSDLHVIDEATLRDSGYLDVSQALQMQVPGLYLAPRNGPFSYVDLSLQGSRTGDVLWTVDGVRINNRLYTSTSPADTLPASMIDRIEVLKGGQSLFYGTQAAAGVINVVTRGFSSEPGGAFSIGGDTNQGVHVNAYGRGAVGEHQLVVWGSKDEAEGYETFDAYQPSATARKRGYDVVSAGVKYGYALTDELDLTLQYQHTDARLDYPGARLTRLSFNDRDEEIVAVRLDYTPSDRAQLFLKGYYHDWDTVYTTVNNVPGDPAAAPVVVDELTYWGYEDYGVSVVGKFRPHRGFEYQVGYDFQNFNGRDDVLLIADKTETVHAFIGQLLTTEELAENLRLAAGFRYNRSQAAETTIWNVSGRWDIAHNLYLEGVGGTSFILPSAEQLFGIDPCCAVGNPNLEAEESLNANLALGGQVGQLAWQVTGFARKIDNLIGEAILPAQPEGIYVNSDGEVNVIGAEVLTVFDLAQDLRGQLSYTWTRARQEGAGRQLDRTPEHFAKASLSWSPADRPFGVVAAANWTGAVYSNVSGFGVQNYGEYLVVDLAAHVFLDGQKRRHRLNARLENLFDEAYATRISSAVIDGSTSRFIVRNRGVPRTLHVTYTYEF